MVILKFSMLLFLMGTVWMVTRRQLPLETVGGPFYFADPPGSIYPLQPRWRLRHRPLGARATYVEAYYDERCLPIVAIHRLHRQELWRMTWVWDAEGGLHRRTLLDPQGHVLASQQFHP